MVPGAVRKADHVSQAEEFELLRDLLAQRPKILWRDNPSPARKWQAAHELHSSSLSPASVAGTEWKPLVKVIVRVTRDVLHRDAKTGLWSSTAEVAYYVANSPIAARHAATAIRCNSLHCTRDVTFQEDQSRIRHNPGVFARLRCAPSPTTSCVAIRLQRSIRIATPPLSAVQLRALNSPACVDHRYPRHSRGNRTARR